MTIESTLERIATALEKIASAPKADLAPASPKRSSKAQSTESPKASASAETKPAEDTVASASEASSTSSSDKETDDLFGDPEPAKEEKVKEVTIDDVRAKLVEVQTKFKHKDHALACLKKISGGMVLSGLKKEDHGKLVDLCTEALKKDTPPKF